MAALIQGAEFSRENRRAEVARREAKETASRNGEILSQIRRASYRFNKASLSATVRMPLVADKSFRATASLLLAKAKNGKLEVFGFEGRQKRWYKLDFDPHEAPYSKDENITKLLRVPLYVTVNGLVDLKGQSLDPAKPDWVFEVITDPNAKTPFRFRQKESADSTVDREDDYEPYLQWTISSEVVHVARTSRLMSILDFKEARLSVAPDWIRFLNLGHPFRMAVKNYLRPLELTLTLDEYPIHVRQFERDPEGERYRTTLENTGPYLSELQRTP